jgi:hypothetical protein
MVRYRRSLVGFVRALPIWLERPVPDDDRSAIAVDAPALDASGDDGESRSGLTAIDGGLR